LWENQTGWWSTLNQGRKPYRPHERPVFSAAVAGGENLKREWDSPRMRGGTPKNGIAAFPQEQKPKEKK